MRKLEYVLVCGCVLGELEKMRKRKMQELMDGWRTRGSDVALR